MKRANRMTLTTWMNRGLRRLLAPVALGVLAVLLAAVPAAAARSWCFKDPIVTLNGTPVQILVAIPEEDVPLVNGPIEVQVETPSGVSTRLVSSDDGFNGYGETVRFSGGYGSVALNGSFPVRVTVRVPLDAAQAPDPATVPVRVTVVPDGQSPLSGEGTAASTRVTLTLNGSGLQGGLTGGVLGVTRQVLCLLGCR